MRAELKEICSRPSRALRWAPELLAAAAAAAFFWWLYARALSYTYQFDDFPNIIQNRAIRYLFHPRIFLESINLRERPVTNLSYALNYALTDLSLSGFRIWNYVLHFANAVLVWRLGSFFLGRAPALLAAGLFLLHPIAADSVVYLSGRSALLSLFFQLTALALYAEARQGFWKWLLFLSCAALAMLSKESGATTVLLIFLIDRQLVKRRGEVVPYVAPLFLGAAVAVWIKFSYLSNALLGVFLVQGEGQVRGFEELIRLQLSLWPRILALFLRPELQAIDHQVWIPVQWTERGVLLGALIVVLLAVAVVRQLKKASPLFFAAGWILLALLPTNSIFPVLDPLGERLLYPALPGVAWLAAWLVAPIAARGAGAIALGGLLAWLGAGATLPRIEVWKSSTSLWMDALAKYPDKYRIVHNASYSIMREGGSSWDSALPLIAHLARLEPGALRHQQQENITDQIASAFRKRYGMEDGPRLRSELQAWLPGFWGDYLWLKVMLPAKPQAKAWLAAWEAAKARYAGPLPDAPGDPLVRDRSLELLAGEYWRRQGRSDIALKHFEPVFAAFPERHMPYWTARDRFAMAYLETNQRDPCIEQLEQLTQQYKVFKNYHVPALMLLAQLYKEKGDYVRASDAAGELVHVMTDDPAVRALYAELLEGRKSRFAARQRKEANFYEKNAIRPTELREAVRP